MPDPNHTADFPNPVPAAAPTAAATTHGDPVAETREPDGGPPAAPAAGDRLDDYEILGELGAGGMGVVYKARQKALNRLVALKMVLAGGRATAAQIARFRGEALAVAKLDHPNIVKVYDIGDHDGLPFFSMEYVGGGSLDRKLNREPLDPADAATLAETLARAADYAHGRGVIHRDLKPANILFQRLTAEGAEDAESRLQFRSSSAPSPPSAVNFLPKITDFGLAKQVADDGDAHTRTGAVMGTPNYMAPEQAEGRTKDVTHLADVYGLGAMLYELLTGRPPFSGPSVVAILSQVRSADPVNPTQLAPGLPRDLETICLKCLQKEPGKRYATAAALADDLARFRAGEAIVARPVSTAEKVVRWVRRKPKEAALWGVAAAAAVTLFAGSLVYAGVVSAKNAEIARQRDAIGVANRDLTAANATLTAERDAAERQQGFFADEWRRMARDVIPRLPPDNLGKDREQFTAYLTKVLGRLDRLTAEDAGISPRVRLAAAVMTGDTRMAIRRAGRIADRDDVRQGLEAYTRAGAIAWQAAAADPASDLARGNLALVRARQADARMALGEWAAAKADADEALALRREIVDAPRSAGDAKVRIFPADALHSLAESHAQLARWAESAAGADPADRAKHLAAATDLRKRALATAQADPTSYDAEWIPLERFKSALAGSYLTAAADAAAANPPRLRDGQELLNEALKLYDRSLTDAADDLPHKPQLASLLFKLGEAYLKAGKPAAAADWFERMRQIADAVLRAGGRAPEDTWRLWNSYYGLGTCARAVGDKAGAAARFRDCVTIADDLVRDDPRPKHVWLRMLALARAGYPEQAAAATKEEAARVAADDTRVPGRFYFVAASTYALAAHAVGRWEPDDKLTADERKQRAAYLEAAWAAAAEVVRLNPPEAKSLDSDPDLEFLHARPGFKERLKELKDKAGVK